MLEIEMEVEEAVKGNYNRDDEDPTPWDLRKLAVDRGVAMSYAVSASDAPQTPICCPALYPVHRRRQLGQAFAGLKSRGLCAPACPQQIELRLSGPVV